MFSPSSARPMISSIQYRASTTASGLFRSIGTCIRLKRSLFSTLFDVEKYTSKIPATWLVMNVGANSSMEKPMDAASMNRFPCLSQHARSFTENCRPDFCTFSFAGDARESRISLFTFADSGLLFAGFLDACI